jgi:hypothetical protein
MHIYHEEQAASSAFRLAVDLKEKVKMTPGRQAIGQSLGVLPAVRTLISGRTEAKIVDQPSDAAFNVVADGTDG